MKAFIMVWIPGSWKSTKAEELARLNNAQIISKDVIREMYTDMKEDDVRKKENELIWDAASNKRSIIVDNTHMNKNSLASVAAFCMTIGYEVKIVDMQYEFANPVDYLVKSRIRNASREWKKYVPRSVIDEMYLANFHTWYDYIYIVDIDWTLANWEHRQHFVNWEWKKDWKSYFELMDNDTIINQVKHVINTLKAQWACIIVVSWRPDTYWHTTENRLNKNDVYFDYLLMRKWRDNRKDTEVKKDIYDKCIKKEHDKVVAVFDDRASVIKMRREQWLYVFNCSLLDNNDF